MLTFSDVSVNPYRSLLGSAHKRQDWTESKALTRGRPRKPPTSGNDQSPTIDRSKEKFIRARQANIRGGWLVRLLRTGCKSLADWRLRRMNSILTIVLQTYVTCLYRKQELIDDS